MGVLKDLGTGVVEGVDRVTGYPKDLYGELLNKYHPEDGELVDGWDRRGTELYNLTNPYGLLEYAVGSGDDFHCFDAAIIDCGENGVFVVLDAVLNSETGGFIEGVHYSVVRIEEYRVEAWQLVEEALEWCAWNDVEHDRDGWNQDPFYFAIDVETRVREMFSRPCPDLSHEEKRFAKTADGRDIDVDFFDGGGK